MTIHVVGAGVAGLVAALSLARAGHAVCVHDAAPAAGGRCAAQPGGTHTLTGADQATLRFLDAIGARDEWIEPEPGGLPLLDLIQGSARRVAMSPRAWRDPARRPQGLTIRGAVALAGMAAGITDRPVALAMAKHPALLCGFVEPLTLAALNTPAAEASSARLGQVLRGLARTAGGRLLVPTHGLGAGLMAPALAALAQAGARMRQGAHLRAMTMADSRAVALHFGPETLAVGLGDAVILALPPWEAARLFTGLRVPERHAPMVSLGFARADAGPVRLIGVSGGLVQRIVVRPGGVSATIYAADGEEAPPPRDLAAGAWSEIVTAARVLALPGAWPAVAPTVEVMVEPRATPRHAVGFPPVAPRRPMQNLALAGDWTWPGLPASIEAAALSGEAAARAIAQTGAARVV